MSALFAIVSNACTLITLNYIALKIRNRMFIEAHETLSAPILTGFASILMMSQSLETDLMTIDLRFAPIVMAALRFGLPIASLSTLLPIGYAYLIHESGIGWSIIQGLLIPAVVGSMFHSKEYRLGYLPLPFADGIKICLWLFFMQGASGLYLIGSANWHWIGANLFLLVISSCAISVLIAMYNEENRNWMQQRELELKANQDSLTRLPNYRSFLDICKSTLKKRKIAILMIDIDNFKTYNDTLGHLQGDRLLREVGEVLRLHIGELDYLARYGGEEFIVMCHATDSEILKERALSLCQSISQTPFPGREVQSNGIVSISVGIAVAKKLNDDLHRIISEADTALYTSKNNGKNRFTLHDEPTSA